MNARDDLALIVPRLRRYARAVIGHAESADRRVGEALEAVAAAPPAPDAVTVASFRELRRALRATPPVPGGGGALDEFAAVDEKVRELAALDRDVLLLHALERFEPDAIARIVERDGAEVNRRLDAAYAALAGGRRGRVVVCAGDPAGAGPLIEAVRDAGHDVVDTTPDGDAALRRVRGADADLLFADLDCGEHAPCPSAVEAVRALDDVGCVAVTTGVDEALAQLADTAVVVISRPVDARVLSVAFAHALRATERLRAVE